MSKAKALMYPGSLFKDLAAVKSKRGALRRNQRHFWSLLVSKVTDKALQYANTAFICDLYGFSAFFHIFCPASSGSPAVQQ